ncbi:hypothetical protein ACQQ97_04445 [Anaerovoracaceae bacterium SGI.195]
MKKPRTISKIMITLICIIMVSMFNFETSFGEPETSDNPTVNEEPADPTPQPEPETPATPGNDPAPAENTDNSPNAPEPPRNDTSPAPISPNDNDDADTQDSADENNSDGEADNPELQSLSISCGDLVPSFSPEIKDYKVYAKDGNKNCKIEANGGNNKIDIDGKEILTDKFQTSKVKVKTANGNENTYTINIVRVDKCDFFEGNNFFYVNNKITAKDILPGYSSRRIKYKGEKIISLISKNNRMKFISYINENNRKEKRWYLIKENDSGLQQSKVVKLGKKNYFAIDDEGKLLYGLYKGKIGFLVVGKDNKVSFYADDKERHDIYDRSFSTYVELLALIAAIVILLLFAMRNLKKKKKSRKSKFSVNTDDLI